MEPIMKWAGGKRQLLTDIERIIKIKDIKGCTFYEPFVGGGAVFLKLEHPFVSINDINSELINVYLQIKENPHKLIRELKKHKENHGHDYYYMIRNLDRTKKYKKMSEVQEAARTIYLNRVCYNGLYRVNTKGEFNVPLGKYVNPEIVFEDKINEISKYLNSTNVTITNFDFEEAVKNAKSGDVVYFDPPYDYEGNGFTSYTCDGFSREDLERLKRTCDSLISKGCRVIVSNNDTSFVNKLFKDSKYKIEHVNAKRMINCKGQKRNSVKEIIIYG